MNAARWPPGQGADPSFGTHFVLLPNAHWNSGLSGVAVFLSEVYRL
jgi:hypothetical protein